MRYDTRILMSCIAIILGMFIQYMIDLPATRLCRPDAYYGASQHVTDPDCGPSDPRCTVDPCR